MFKSQQTAKLKISLLVAAACLLLVAGKKSASQQVIKPDAQETSLQGTVRLIHGYGPPGYGEDPKHDVHVTYWALEVPVPVNTPCTPESDFGCESAKRLKLFFPSKALVRLSDLPAAKWKDQSVTITGKLHHADTLREMTPIYIDVTSIQASPSPSPRKR